MTYDAFLSYSQRADAKLAAELQRSIERLAVPWYRRRPFLRLVRDSRTFPAGVDLDKTIRDALDDSGHLVVLVSPESAASPWVNREIEYWFETKGRQAITVVVTCLHGDGISGGSEQLSLSELDWRGDDVPSALRSSALMPLAVDLRWTRSAPGSFSTDERWADAVAQIAAAIVGRDKDDLVGELVALRRRASILTSAVALGILILAGSLAIAVPSLLFARSQRDDAISSRLDAERAERDAIKGKDEALEEQKEALQRATTRTLIQDSASLTSSNPVVSLGLAVEL